MPDRKGADIDPESIAVLVREDLAQPTQRAPRPRLDGSERPPEPGRDLRLRQLLAIRQDDDGPLGVRHVRQRRLQSLPELGRLERALRARPEIGSAKYPTARHKSLER